MIRFRKILLACAENILAIEQEVWQVVILVTVKCVLVLLITVRSHGLFLLLIYYVGEAKRNLLGSYVALFTLIHLILQNRGAKRVPDGASGKRSPCQYTSHKRHGFSPWVGKVL